MASLDVIESSANFRALPDDIYEAGLRRKNCFVEPDCAAIPRTLIESELLGYERHDTYLRDELPKKHDFEEILGNSAELVKLLDRVQSAAPTDANVLIIGETGSGKELIARAIHSRSGRQNGPLVKVNCGAIPAGLVESELFGHVKGAFTNAS